MSGCRSKQRLDCQWRAFAFALEASLRALLSPEQCLTLLGAEAFAPVEDNALAPTRRALLAAGTA